MSQELVRKIMADVGISLDAQGFAVYNCNGLYIHLEYDNANDALCLYCSLGKLPPKPSQALFEWALETNFLGADTEGGHVGLHKASRTLTYSLSLRGAELEARTLQNALHLFAQRALNLIEEHASKGHATPGADATPATAQRPPASAQVMWG